MADHVKDREQIVQALRQELVGPAPSGEELDCEGELIFQNAEELYKPWKQLGTGEEILRRDSPCKRYGIGALYPPEMLSDDEPAGSADSQPEGAEKNERAMEGADSAMTDAGCKDIAKIQERTHRRGPEMETEDLDLSSANSYKPSTVGISFLAEFPKGAILRVDASGGRYRKKDVRAGGEKRTWWLRSPVSFSAEFKADALCTPGETKLSQALSEKPDPTGLNIRIEVFSRPHGASTRLLTVCLVNRGRANKSVDEACLFQAFFKAQVVTSGGENHIMPYPGPPVEKFDEEEQSLALLYRRKQTYAVGHGCSADWDAAPGTERAKWVSAECLPAFEVPSITPEVFLRDGSNMRIPMAALAGLLPETDDTGVLKDLIASYRGWIDARRKEIPHLRPQYRDAALRHVNYCLSCAERMEAGLEYLKTNKTARRAFQLANHAVLLQQLQKRRSPRRIQYDPRSKRICFSENYQDPNPLNATGETGNWRPFQIAFLLIAVKSAAEAEAEDRRTVELLWFPTGGGKTEAYLGLAAFVMFMRRLLDRDDAGVHAIMRYTLRLLTAQQFQRASSLICAMEHLRRNNVAELGEQDFCIGIWLGGETTPNTREEAIRVLRSLRRGDQFTENMFILSQCPWCGAEIGPAKQGGSLPEAFRVPGYEQRGNTVILRCSDRSCRFSEGLPVYLIDEDIYEKRPSLVIGTVDKFAMLAWRPEARSLFGIGDSGQREISPPGLIIQDELHLISGPLGSMSGLYEIVIEELCTDRRGGRAVVPKIIASTATIRRYQEQARALYGRDQVALFPPPGLEADDSFFARYARDKNGIMERGLLYTGIHAPGLGSVQTAQVRTFTALLQAPVSLSQEERDPWWTLVIFFNSLRELGTALSLLQSDIPDYLKVLRNRTGASFADMRRLFRILELTGRLGGDEVPQAIAALEDSCTDPGNQVVDVCLASNIIEVGVDIDRLSLIAVAGQPKSTSQYIQVTGRIGRRWRERPGLVATVYSPSKPRDRSHFEKFRSYHERLYAQVEPTSVTPFSAPALDRALHAVMVAYVRQLGDRRATESPYPYPEDLIAELKGIIMPRVEATNPDEARQVQRVFEKRADEWRRWERRLWKSGALDGDIPLLRPAGDHASPEWSKLSWPTPLSMRNVDAECQIEITNLYLNPSAEEQEGPDA